VPTISRCHGCHRVAVALLADRRSSSDVCSHRPRPHRSPASVLVTLLLLLGGVESNPGPTSTVNRTARETTRAGLLNVRSARQKAALIQNVIADCRLDVLVLTEAWIPSDVQNAVKMSSTATVAHQQINEAEASRPPRYHQGNNRRRR